MSNDSTSPAVKQYPREVWLTLDSIFACFDTQPRIEIDWALVDEYAELYRAGVKMPPIVVFEHWTNTTSPQRWIADGFHRYHAARKAGKTKIHCQLHLGTLADAQWFSYAANQTHGLRRTNADKAKAVKAALRHPCGAKMSDPQIAEYIGVSSNTVAKYRAELETTSQIEKSEKRVGKDGREVKAKHNKAKAVKSALRHPCGAKLSDPQIAEYIGVSSNTVAKYRAELQAGSQIETLPTRKGKDGKEYKAKQNKPQPPAPPPPAPEPPEPETDDEPDHEPVPAADHGAAAGADQVVEGPDEPDRLSVADAILALRKESHRWVKACPSRWQREIIQALRDIANQHESKIAESAGPLPELHIEALSAISMLKRGVAETYAEFATDFRFRAMCHRFPTEISDRHPIAVNIAKILEGVRGLDEWLSANFHICASCGTRLPHDGAECPKCGPAEADEDEEDPAAVTCPNCGCCEVDDDGDCKSCLHQKVAPPSDGAPIKTATIGTITYEVEKRGTQWFYRVDEAAGWTCAGAEMAKLIEEGAADE